MKRTINRQLNLCYYSFFVLAVAVAALLFYLIKQQYISTFDPQSTTGQVLQYIVIAYTLASVAGGLYIFKKQLEKVKLIESNDDKLLSYRRYAIIRLCVIGVGITLGIACFYLLGGYKSMIWCAAVSTIALYFCKPTERRIELETELDQSQTDQQ